MTFAQVLFLKAWASVITCTAVIGCASKINEKTDVKDESRLSDFTYQRSAPNPHLPSQGSIVDYSTLDIPSVDVGSFDNLRFLSYFTDGPSLAILGLSGTAVLFLLYRFAPRTKFVLGVLSKILPLFRRKKGSES